MGNIGSTTQPEDSPTSTPSATALLELIDWTALPAATRQTIRTVGPLMQEGCSRQEIATRLGWPESRVAAAVAEMLEAILDQCATMIDDLEPKIARLVNAHRKT